MENWTVPQNGERHSVRTDDTSGAPPPTPKRNCGHSVHRPLKFRNLQRGMLGEIIKRYVHTLSEGEKFRENNPDPRATRWFFISSIVVPFVPPRSLSDWKLSLLRCCERDFFLFIYPFFTFEYRREWFERKIEKTPHKSFWCFHNVKIYTARYKRVVSFSAIFFSAGSFRTYAGGVDLLCFPFPFSTFHLAPVPAACAVLFLRLLYYDSTLKTS
jgi:hypothetical protein